jgi:hypothetical protein
MRKKIVAYFATTGLLIGLVSAVYAFVPRLWSPIATDLMLWLCPPSLGSMALDSGSTSTAVVVWLLFALENAVLYAVVGGFLIKIFMG